MESWRKDEQDETIDGPALAIFDTFDSDYISSTAELALDGFDCDGEYWTVTIRHLSHFPVRGDCECG